MMPRSTLALPASMHAAAREHLFPGDGLEAAAIILCSRTPGPRLKLLGKRLILVPHPECSIRTEDLLSWPGHYIEQAIDEGEAEDLVAILIHSHPGGFLGFSDQDDTSDAVTIPALFAAYGDLHGSAVMIPCGRICARLYTSGNRAEDVELVTIAGNDLHYYWHGAQGTRPMAFTEQMTREINRLSAAVIGASGTGSITTEQLARLWFGNIALIDFDRIEHKNLNRILNSTLADADSKRLKVDVMVEAIEKFRGAGSAVGIAHSISSREGVLAASQADVIFCCADTLEARYMADLIGAAFLIPVIDVGVVIPTRSCAKAGTAVADAMGRIDYVQPGRSTLRSRGLYTPESLRAEYLRLNDPEAHRRELAEGYIKGTHEEAPSVITLNMRAASACVNEFVARAFPYRHEPNGKFARTMFSLAALEEEFESESSFQIDVEAPLSRGDLEPLLGLPALKAPSAKDQK